MEKTESYSVKKEIITAFIKLMSEKSYSDIGVTDIVVKAGVARSSFYRNFNSINDIADSIADSVYNEFVMDVFPVLNCTDERKWREFLFNHFYMFLKKHEEMKKIRFDNMSILFTRIDNRIQKMTSGLPTCTIKDKYVAIAKIGLINNITKKWMDSGAKETPEEMVDYIMSFITSF